MIVRFVEEAQSEYLDAISSYEETRANLGARFKNEVNRCVVRIAGDPEFYRLRPGDYRRVNLRIFPYYISYIVRGETLWILAVAHAARKPLHWISRRNRVA